MLHDDRAPSQRQQLPSRCFKLLELSRNRSAGSARPLLGLSPLSARHPQLEMTLNPNIGRGRQAAVFYSPRAKLGRAAVSRAAVAVRFCGAPAESYDPQPCCAGSNDLQFGHAEPRMIEQKFPRT